jgi:hypothetical protein
MTNFVQAIRDHAVANYKKDGWDIVVECWADDEIVEATDGAKTLTQAIRKVKALVKPFASYRSEIMSTAW